MKKKILVTGASGMTGAALVLRLAQEGHWVNAFCRSSLPFFSEYSNITWIKGDVQNINSVRAAVQGVNEVYHLAAIANHWAPDRRDFYRTNVQGTINLLEAARDAGVGRIVITSSVGVIGPGDQDHVVPIDETNVRMVRFFNDYETTKAIVHDRVQDYVRAGMDIVLVLPSRIWGAGPIDAKNSVMFLLARHLEKKMMAVPGSGLEIGNFISLEDAVEGHILAMKHGRTGEKYFLGGQNLTMDQIADHFAEVTNRKPWLVHFPFFLVRCIAAVEWVLSELFGRYPMTTQDTVTRLHYHCPISIKKAQEELGFQPTDFNLALEKAIDWLKNKDRKWPVPSEKASLGGFDENMTYTERNKTI